MNHKAKGSRGEHKAIRLLEALGFVCMRSAASRGPFDMIGISAHEVKLLQIKCGQARCSPAEREALQLLPVPANCSKEIWTFVDRCREPRIQRV